jgi:hypothetical protein
MQHEAADDLLKKYSVLLIRRCQMRILVQLSALCYAMFICGTATADVTAGKVRDLCISKSEPAKIACGMYIIGFREGHLTGMYSAAGIILGSAVIDRKRSMDEDYQRFSYFCLPSAVTNGQVIEVFVKYVNEHPEKLHLSSSTQLTDALLQYFPCKREIKE